MLRLTSKLISVIFIVIFELCKVKFDFLHRNSIKNKVQIQTVILFDLFRTSPNLSLIMIKIKYKIKS